MFFKFLVYIKPTWYLRLRPAINNSFVDVQKLAPKELSLLDVPDCYKTDHALTADLTLQAWFKGLVPSAEEDIDYTLLVCDNIFDNYRFLRRFFHPVWSVYVLLLRLFTLHNPIKEIGAFLQARPSTRLKLFDQVNHATGIDRFTGKLVHDRVFVSIIIPTLNRYPYLKDTLHDLEKQDYDNFEVIVVDQSDPFDEIFYKQFKLDISVRRQNERALWLARNSAIRASSSDLVLLFDDDSRVGPDWIRCHMNCLDFYAADISSGVSKSVVGGPVPLTYSFYKCSDQIDTGNVMIRKEVFRRVGLFDRQFEKQRMGDGEFGLRCYLTGIRNISNPTAARIHLKVRDGGLREMGSWDAFRPKKFLDPRPIPSVLYFFRRYFGRQATLFSLIKDVPGSVMPYKLKGKRVFVLIGASISILLLPVVVLQIWRSWRLATIKIEEGAKIENL